MYGIWYATSRQHKASNTYLGNLKNIFIFKPSQFIIGLQKGCCNIGELNFFAKIKLWQTQLSQE